MTCYLSLQKKTGISDRTEMGFLYLDKLSEALEKKLEMEHLADYDPAVT